MARVLRRIVFGNPLLRKSARQLSTQEIISPEFMQLVEDMQHTLETKKYGVALAAPQVGRSVAIIVVGVKPTPTRPQLKHHAQVYINPVITQFYGQTKPEWEGCISLGATSDPIFAQTLRYPKIDVQFIDLTGAEHQETVEGFLAQVLQHEIDHLNGILFTDRVADMSSFMNASEYKKLAL